MILTLVAVVHRTVNRVLMDMYTSVLWSYVQLDGGALPENPEFFVNAFRDTIRIFTDAGITLGHPPEGVAIAPNDAADFRSTDRLVRSLNLGIRELEEEMFDTPEYSERIQAKLQFANQLLAQIPP